MFNRSRKTMPGSPFNQACWTMLSNTSLARSFLATFLVRGLTRSYSWSYSTACMNFSVMPTEMLKLVNFSLSSLQEMKSIMFGWSTRRMAMLAPLRVPPCLMVSVAALNTVMKEMGPLLTPLVDSTTSSRGRMRENEKPVPPPVLWMRAVFFTASKMLSIESPTGSTKHADSCCSSRPAFINVGELGRNSRLVMRS